MINPNNRKKIKRTIGRQHISKIDFYLRASDIRRADNEFYSRQQISNVFNGQDHFELEDAIYEAQVFYHKMNVIKDLEKESRSKLMSTQS